MRPSASRIHAPRESIRRGYHMRRYLRCDPRNDAIGDAMTGARRATLESRVEPALVAAAEQAIREALALPLAKLTRVKLTAEAKLELERQLVARGLERTPKAMRVPIDAQIAALLEDGRRVPLKDIPRRVKGAPRTEIT